LNDLTDAKKLVLSSSDLDLQEGFMLVKSPEEAIEKL
jgi:hypothetical protein